MMKMETVDVPCTVNMNDSANNTNQLQDSIFISVTMVISLFILLSVFINLMIIMAVKKYKRLQIPANFILINLSVADFGVAITSLLYLATNLINPKSEAACIVTLSLVFLTCSASLLSLALIAFDRFSALVKPLTYTSRLTNMRILLYVALIWIYTTVVTVISLFVMLLYRNDGYHSQEEYSAVTNDWEKLHPSGYLSDVLCYRKQSANIALLSLICFIFIPGGTMMFYCYGRVMMVARHHSRAISAMQGNFRQSKLNKNYGMFKGKKYFVTLTSILGVFTLTWVLFVILILLDIFCKNCFNFGYLPHSYICSLVLVSTGINPWIYACRSHDLKAAFIRLFKSVKSYCKGEKPPINTQRRDSRFSDGLSRTNSIIGNMQYLQALYSDAYYNQKNQNNNRTCPSPLALRSLSRSVQSLPVKSEPRQDPGLSALTY